MRHGCERNHEPLFQAVAKESGFRRPAPRLRRHGGLVPRARNSGFDLVWIGASANLLVQRINHHGRPNTGCVVVICSGRICLVKARVRRRLALDQSLGDRPHSGKRRIPGSAGTTGWSLESRLGGLSLEIPGVRNRPLSGKCDISSHILFLEDFVLIRLDSADHRCELADPAHAAAIESKIKTQSSSERPCLTV